ncbi:MAG: alpha/beta fold hydrolase [Thermonemataceae bacterium]
MQFRTSDKRVWKKFEAIPQKVQVERYQVANRTVRYINIGADTLPTVLFIHGAPGSADAFFSYLKDTVLLEKARMISVDRPGYGYSDFGKAEVSVAQQAKLIAPLLDQFANGHPFLVVGHSYGGTIAARLAMDFPEKVDYLIMAAPAIDPDNEKKFWVNKPADWAIFKWAIPKAVRVSNDEKLAHVAETAKMLPDWQKVTMPVTYIHGEKDGIVPFANAAFAKEVLQHNPDTTFILKEKMGHLFVFNEKEVLKEAILAYL